MCNCCVSDSKWFLVTIDDPAFLSAKSILKVIQLLLSCISFKFVIINDVEGAADNWVMNDLQETENTVLNLDDFLNNLCKVKLFEWGDFFLFREYPKNWDNSDKSNGTFYPPLIAQSDTTVRGIDGQYIYIYTQDQKIIDALKKNYRIESITANSLELLEYPY